MVFTEYPKEGIILLVSVGKAMQYPSTFQVMKAYVFMGQPMKGIVSVLCSFEDEQYPSNIINPWCLILEYLNEGIGFLVSFGRVTLSCVKRYVMELNVFLGCLKRGIADVLNSFGHEQYPFNNLNQNNLAHGVYNVAQ
jgi:hypothetical protein